MNLQACTGMSNRRIQLAISSIIYRTHFSHKDKSQLLLIPQAKLSILSQPLHILLAEEMMEQKSCRKLIRFMVRLKSRRHQASLLHQSAHRTNTSTLSLSKIRIMENLTDSWIAKHRAWLSPIILRFQRIAWIVNLNTIGIADNLNRLIHSIRTMNIRIDYRLT